jgi:hypothetical protein
MKKNLIINTLLIFSFVFILGVVNGERVSAGNSQWHWISVPSDPMTGYFREETEEVLNTIGYTEEEQTLKSSATQTVVLDSFMETLQSTEESDRCSEKLDDALIKLRQFDVSHEFYIPFDCAPYSINCKGDTPASTPIQETIEGRINLLNKIENDAEDCLKAEQLAKRKAEEERERLRAERKHQRDIEEAIEECNFEFFEEEMTSSERMQTYEQRMACRERQVLGVSETKAESQEVVTVSEDERRAALLNQIQVLMRLITKLQSQLLSQQNGLRS